MPVEIKCCWSSSHENSNTPSAKANKTGRRTAPSISADPSLSRHRDCCARTDITSSPVKLHRVVVNSVGRLDQAQKLGIWPCKGSGRYGEKKLPEPGNRNITCIALHCHRATGAIDDRRIKHPPVFNAQGITLRRANLQSGRPVADVVELVLVHAVATDLGGLGAARRRTMRSWPCKVGYPPIAGAVPDPIPDRDALV